MVSWLFYAAVSFTEAICLNFLTVSLQIANWKIDEGASKSALIIATAVSN
jgi:hypothetical protein